MTKPNKKSIFAKMFHAFAKDASAEEVEAAMDAMGEGSAETNPEEKANDENPNEAIANLASIVAELSGKVDKLMKVEKEEGHEGLDELEKELDEAEKEKTDDEETEKTDDAAEGEESVTVEADEMKCDECGGTKKAGDSAAVRSLIKTLKPIIAGLKDSEERKRVGDSLVASLRGSMPKAGAKDGYKQVLEAKTAPDNHMDDLEKYQASCASRNPHNKGGK